MTARLSRTEIDDRARCFGFVLLSRYEQYESNETVLKWRCGANPAHTVDLTLGHLRRGCPECRQPSRDAQRRYGEFDAVGEIVLAGGDVLLSGPADYLTQNSLIRYVCSLCGEEGSQSAAKVKKGQRHVCQNMAAAQSLRRQ